MARTRGNYIRFLGNRMMCELVLGRQLTRAEQRKLFNKSSIKLEKEIYEKKTPFATDDLLLERSRHTGAFAKQ